MTSKLYPQEIQDFIHDNHLGIGPKKMALLLNETFGKSYTHNQIQTYYNHHKLNSGVTGYFAKGNVPHNKGQKGVSYEGTQATQFKPGQVSHRKKPIGSERVNSLGYVEVKIRDAKSFYKSWKVKHLVVWEEEYGPVPEGHVVIFGDGNKRNFNIGNLILVSRQQLARMNQNGLIWDNADLTRTGAIIAEVLCKIGERQRNKGGSNN